MKIAVLAFFNGRNERGVERWVDEVFSRLSENHEVCVFQNWESKNSVYKTFVANIPFDISKGQKSFLWRLFLDYKSLKIFNFVLKITPWLWAGDFDLVIPTDGGWEPAVVRILTWLKGKRMVIVGHSGIGWDERNNLFCMPDCFVALTKTALSWCARVNPLIKIKLVPDGVDIKVFKHDGKNARIGLKKPIILAVGALEKNKRLDLTISAVAHLKNVSLLILGMGSQEDNLRALGNKLLKERFMLKRVVFGEMPKYYRACDLFTLVSWEREAFGMVYLEAMASGLPIVATNDETRREIIGDAGILIDPTNIVAYSQALKNSLKINWATKPRKQAGKYSLDRIVGEYERLFVDLVKE